MIKWAGAVITLLASVNRYHSGPVSAARQKLHYHKVIIDTAK